MKVHSVSLQEGGCSVPVAVHTEVKDSQVRHAHLLSPAHDQMGFNIYVELML